MTEEGARLVEYVEGRCMECGDCWIWQGCTQFGSPSTPQMKWNNKTSTVRRLLWAHVRGVIRGGLIVTNGCESRMCVNPDHLTLSSKQGLLHAINKEYPVRRRGKPRKLTMEQAREIRRAEGNYIAIGARFGVSHTTVGQIKKHRIWAEPNPFAGLGAR